jgi:hypothetical protein
MPFGDVGKAIAEYRQVSPGTAFWPACLRRTRSHKREIPGPYILGRAAGLPWRNMTPAIVGAQAYRRHPTTCRCPTLPTVAWPRLKYGLNSGIRKCYCISGTASRMFASCLNAREMALFLGIRRDMMGDAGGRPADPVLGLFLEQFGGLDGLREHRDQFVCLFGRHPETGLR